MPRPSDVLVHRNRTVADREERTLTADVYCPESPAATEIAETTASPAAEASRPLVVFVYGGAWETGSTGQFARWALDAADKGFVAAEVSYRLGHEAPFPAQIEDVCEGIDWVVDRADEFGIDPDAVAVVGHSAGAHLALLAALSDGDEFGRRTGIDAAVGVSGVYDLRADDHERAGESLPLFDGRPSAAELRRCSPITDVDGDPDSGVAPNADAPPTLLLHGSEDSVVAPDQSARLADALDAVGATVEYDRVSAADHVFLHSSYHYPAVRKRVFSFLRESL
ncbi:lipase/esterase [Haloferax prahovense DSM 18310]|uniref:Lipase/esterase n=1 Tax=Haloferax prahovense (strain DSM 18310 / JCM 13924 / TL6) TaxID=1227461 RepID=M0GQI8_HALPT|nr:alpha/beta hydrolase [Haloferax prahovense]ELZ73843.1 lipase/esterase [Haloferax prahovense DSM 18310]